MYRGGYGLSGRAAVDRKGKHSKDAHFATIRSIKKVHYLCAVGIRETTGPVV